MDLILINGKIAAGNNISSFLEAAAVNEGKIIKTGKSEEILKLKDKDTRIIDLKGKTVLPGFNDSHLHLLNYAYSLTKLDCSSLTSIDEIIKNGKIFMKEKKLDEGQWLLGRGWNQILFDKKKEPTRYDLDKISKKHPISLTRICEHILVANSKAMELSGITNNTPQPEGGHFDIDENGELTGVFRETARHMIYENIPDIKREDIKKMLLEVARIASSYGITSVQTDDFETFPDKDYKKIIDVYRELVEEKSLPIRIYEQCLLPDINRLNSFLGKGYKTGWGDEFFKIGPLKLLTDGSLGARTAYLCEPYSDDTSSRGIRSFTQDELDNLVMTAHQNDMQVLTHAIGDAAMYMCFESFEKAQKKHFKEDSRFGIVHLQITDKKLLDKFKELNVIAYAEPICVNNDLHMAEERVGRERIKYSYNYKTLFEKGVKVCLSSDCPVDSLNPMDSIYVATTRKDYSGYPAGGWYPEERLTLDQAIYGFTLGSAYASFEENIKGTIEEGKLADMVVLSEDIYTISKDDIRNIKADMTIMNGKVVYER